MKASGYGEVEKASAIQITNEEKFTPRTKLTIGGGNLSERDIDLKNKSTGFKNKINPLEITG